MSLLVLFSCAKSTRDCGTKPSKKQRLLASGHRQYECQRTQPALATAPTGSPQQQTCTSLLEEVHRLKAIVQKLFLLSLADSGRLKIHRESTDFAALLANVIEDCAALAPLLAKGSLSALTAPMCSAR